jgi:hypothetical protein
MSVVKEEHLHRVPREDVDDKQSRSISDSAPPQGAEITVKFQSDRSYSIAAHLFVDIV